MRTAGRRRCAVDTAAALGCSSPMNSYPPATRRLPGRAQIVVVSLLGFLCGGTVSAAPATNTAGLLRAADAALQQGERGKAAELVAKAIAADPRSPLGYTARGQLLAGERQYAKAVADFDQAIKLDPKVATVYQARGVGLFMLGRFAPAVADFDKVIELVPTQAAHHWQRGIALYYAGRFEDGRKQFEQHQTVNPNDVENAVWHYLCVARIVGVEKARALLIPIAGDGRVPMMQVHALFGGKAGAADVLAAARAGNPSPTELDHRLLYAHLYLGLYYEAAGDKRLAREHIEKAATEFKADHYMAEVAQVHARLLRQQAK